MVSEIFQLCIKFKSVERGFEYTETFYHKERNSCFRKKDERQLVNLDIYLGYSITMLILED